MALKPYEQVAPEGLVFPIGGKTYAAPPISLKVGALLATAMEGGAAETLAEESRSLWQMVLGPVYDEMLADDVPAEAVGRAGFCVLVDFQAGREAAERVWESGIDPEARAAKKAASRVADSTTSPSTDVDESSTKPPESTSTTTSPTRRRKSPSRGPKSSDAGVS